MAASPKLDAASSDKVRAAALSFRVCIVRLLGERVGEPIKTSAGLSRLISLPTT
jgi:hypothetical protein